MKHDLKHQICLVVCREGIKSQQREKLQLWATSKIITAAMEASQKLLQQNTGNTEQR